MIERRVHGWTPNRMQSSLLLGLEQSDRVQQRTGAEAQDISRSPFLPDQSRKVVWSSPDGDRGTEVTNRCG